MGGPQDLWQFEPAGSEEEPIRPGGGDERDLRKIQDAPLPISGFYASTG